MRPWLNEDLQSFTPLRFAPPELMNYEGRAVVMDPDIFAIGDIWELLQRDMAGAALMCRPKSGSKGRKGAFASSVMLLDCAKLRHWQFESNFAEMFEPVKRDYMDWVSLKLEDPATIGLFENYWNDFDQPDRRQPNCCTTPSAKPNPGKPGSRSTIARPTPSSCFPPGTGCAAVAAPCLATTNLPAPMPPTPTPGRKRFSSGWCGQGWKTASSPKPSCAMRSHRAICARDALQLIGA